jgi:hypothetical protein
MLKRLMFFLPKNTIVTNFIPISTNLLNECPDNLTKNNRGFVYIDNFKGVSNYGVLYTSIHTDNYVSTKLYIEDKNKNYSVDEKINIYNNNNNVFFDYKLIVNNNLEMKLYMEKNNIDFNMLFNNNVKKIINNIEESNITNKYVIMK